MKLIKKSLELLLTATLLGTSSCVSTNFSKSMGEKPPEYWIERSKRQKQERIENAQAQIPLLDENKRVFSAHAGISGLYIFLTDSDYEPLIEIRRGGVHPVLSPDEKKILFEGTRWDEKKGDIVNTDLYVLNIETWEKINLTSDIPHVNWGGLSYKSWSPDSKQVIFTAVYRKYPDDKAMDDWKKGIISNEELKKLEEEKKGIYVVNIDGSKKQCIFPSYGYGKFSPSGKKIVFTADCEHFDSITYDLYISKSDGSDRRTIACTAGYLGRIKEFDKDGKERRAIMEAGFLGTREIQWSDDETKILLYHEFNSPFSLGGLDSLFLINVNDGSGDLLFRGYGLSVFNPTANLEKIALVVYGDDKKDFKKDKYGSSESTTEILISDTKEKTIKNVTRHPSDDDGPLWLDEESIEFISDREGKENYYRVNADGTNLEKLTNGPIKHLPKPNLPSWLRIY